MIESSLWTAPFAGTPPTAPADVPRRTDVAIVGAGYTGLSAALALARRGIAVTVFEAERVGFGASSRNGGMVLTGLKVGPEALLRAYGPVTARALFDASLLALETLERLVADEDIDCAYVRCGHLEVASKPKHFEGFLRSTDLYGRCLGHTVRALARDELASEIGSNAYAGGMLDERSGGIDPYRYALGLADAARRAGATILEGTAVRRLERTAGAWIAHTDRGAVTSTNALVATGGYTGEEFGQLRRRLVPLGSYVIATDPLDPDLARSLIPNGRMIFDSKRLLHYYRLTPDSRMLFGGRAAFVPASASTTRQSAAILQRDMISVFPQLRDTPVAYAWGGRLDVTFDIMPHSGRLDDYYYASGYAGHGVALATLLGSMTANAIADGEAPSPFDRPLPAAPLGLYNGRAWFLPLVGAWQRFLDIID